MLFPPNVRVTGLDLLYLGVAFGRPRLGTRRKTERKEPGWAFWVTTTPHPPAWSRADSAPPPCFSIHSPRRSCSSSSLCQWLLARRGCITRPFWQARSLPTHTRCYRAGTAPATGPTRLSSPALALLWPGSYHPSIAVCYISLRRNGRQGRISLRCASRCERPPRGLVVLASLPCTAPCGVGFQPGRLSTCHRVP